MGSGGGSIDTEVEHYTDFMLNNLMCRCYGDVAFGDGDLVVLLLPDSSSNGMYTAQKYKNFTRKFMWRCNWTPRSVMSHTLTSALGWFILGCLIVLVTSPFLGHYGLNLLLGIGFVVIQLRKSYNKHKKEYETQQLIANFPQEKAKKMAAEAQTNAT